MSAVPALLVVADRDYLADDERWLQVLREVGQAAAGAPVAIQIRARRASPQELVPLAERARAAVPRMVPLILSGEAALAASLGYDGVHWPEAALRRAVDAPGLRWRSAAVHGVAAVRAAEQAGANLLVFGAVFAPRSKDGPSFGLGALREAASATTLPVLAIGGIGPERVPACLDAGARGVAVVSGVLGARSPSAAITAYLAQLAVSRASATQHMEGVRP